MGNKLSNSDDLLKNLFEPKPIKVKESLEDLFNQRLVTLNISKTTALGIMRMSLRTLDGILSGQQTRLDYTQLIKLSNFLSIDLLHVTKLYFDKINSVHSVGKDISTINEKVEFVNKNFDLACLKKVGLIKSLTDYNEIINSISNYFGLVNILDYSEPDMSVAFSSGKKAKQNRCVKNWIYLAEQTCIELRNPNAYNREGLIDYFSQIRWQSMDVENGLVNVIKQLYQLGITVVFIPSLPSVHVRGATFEVNNKPCIALTDYKGFYPTLWFALVHELYHVLFDWDEIFASNYHVSIEANQSLYSRSKNEIEADKFAREYLFSVDKTKEASLSINNHEYVKQYARSNNVDPSFVYVFYAYDAPRTDKYAWGRAQTFNPNIEIVKSKLQHRFDDNFSFNEHIIKLRYSIYN